MNKIIKKHGLNFGLILGFLLIMPSLLGYAFDVSLLMSFWTLALVFASVIIVGAIAIIFVKKKLNGFISFKEAFSTYFITLLIGLLISNSINFLLFNIVDTNFTEVVKEEQIKMTESRREWVIGNMNNGQTPESKIDEVNSQFDERIEKIKKDNPYSINSLIKGFAIFTGIFSIFGLLLALVLKKKNTENV